MVLLLTCAHWCHIDYTPDAVPAEPEGLSRIPITPVTYFLWPSGQADACTVTNHAQRDLNSVTKTEYVTNENLWILNLWISTKNILTWTNNPICLTQTRWGCLNQPSSTHTLQGNLSVEPKTTHWVFAGPVPLFNMGEPEPLQHRHSVLISGDRIPRKSESVQDYFLIPGKGYDGK